MIGAVPTALTAEGIPCNVLVGDHHDHFLVPADQSDQAVAAIVALSDADRP